MLVFRRSFTCSYEDTWRLHPRFVVNYGLGWTYDAPLNYDLPQTGLSGACSRRFRPVPTRKNWKKLLAVPRLRLEPEG